MPRCRRRRRAFPPGTPRRWPNARRALERAGDLIEQNRGRLIALLQSEGGKTLDDCVSEVREAVDYCRYYAAEARRTLAPQALPGPTGESNELRYRGRGVFVCISPWNFPLAIFSARSPARSPPAMRWWPSPPSRRRSGRLRGGEAPARRRRAGERAASRAGRRHGRRHAGRRSARRRRRLHRLDGSRPPHQPRARRQGRADRAADRRDRRHQCHDRRRHRAARAGDRRRHHLGLPLRRPALFGVAPAVRAGRCRRPRARHDRGRRARTRARRSARSGDPCRAGDRRRGQGQTRPLDRRHGVARRGALPLGRRAGAAVRRAPMSRPPSSNSTARAS